MKIMSWKCLNVALFFVAFVSLVPVLQAAQPSDMAKSSDWSSSSGSTLYMCSDDGGSLPSGYVIVGSSTDYRCPGSYNYRWRLEPVEDGIWACMNTTYPSPYFITEETENPGGGYECEDSLGKIRLSLPENNLTVCVNGVMWTPWVITMNSNSYLCGGYASATIHQPSEGLRVCSNSVIPPGWYTDNASAYYICDPYLRETLHQSTASVVSPKSNKGFPKYIKQGNRAVMRSVSR